jgi:hypothetical protein
MNQARTPPLRVLMLLHNLSVGGVGIVVHHLAHELARIGCRPVVCGWRRGGPLEARFRAAGISVVVPPAEQGGWRRLKVPSRLREIVARHRIDLIHAHMSDSAAWGVLLQHLTGRPCVVSHHGNDLIDAVRPGRPAYRWARHRLLLSCAARAATNVAVSESIRQRLAARARLPPNRLLVVGTASPSPRQERSSALRPSGDGGRHCASRRAPGRRSSTSVG